MDGSWRELAGSNDVGSSSRSRAQRAAKRTYDITAALAGLVFLSPAMVIVALFVKLQDGGPVLFAHRRIGKNGAAFKCYKFRSMVLDADKRLVALLASDPDAAEEWARDQKLRNDPRVTPLGRFLRKSSLDELPQLFNILKGDMSVVGPRPIVADEIVRYGAHFEAYKSVTPGITGPWQVSGRNDVTYDERVEMDAEYAANWTVAGDIWITLKTVPSVLFSRGAS